MLLRKEVNDPRLKDVVITDVITSRDLSSAKVYFSAAEDAQKEVAKLLKNASGFFRTRLSKVLDLRHTPTLSFIYDTAPNTGANIEDLLSKLQFLLKMSRRNKKGRDINGVILLDKSTGASSNFVLQQVKRLFFAKKAGHTGSLDPLASGLLPICLGQATKVAQFLLDDDKRYFVRGKLGQVSDTGDAEGLVTEFGSADEVDESSVAEVLPQFLGNIKQVPPMYSALKRDGKPLYELARQGIEVEREARPVTIHEINFIGLNNDVMSLDVACSKGTYIRTLVEDIGKVLGCGAHVIELRRTGFAHFDLTDSITFEQLEALKSEDFEALDAQIFDADTMLPNLESVFLSAEQSSDVKLGRKVRHGNFVEVQKLKLFDENQEFIGIGESNLEGEVLPKRLFVQAIKKKVANEKTIDYLF